MALAVIWTDLVNVTVVGTTITKTGGITTDDAGAASVQTIAGDGYVEWTNPATNKSYWVGLTTVPNPGFTYTGIDFGISVALVSVVADAAPAWVGSVESGVSSAQLSTAITGDVFRVSVDSNVVTYWKNGTLLATSAGTPTFPLLVDMSMMSVGAAVEDAEIDGTVVSVQLTDTSTSDVYAWAWDFGDGTTSALQNPNHSFTVDGTYVVTLRATSSKGTVSTSKVFTFVDGVLTVTDLITGQTPGADPQVMLRISNDGGKTWVAESWRSAGRVGEYLQRVDWNRLGCARRRVFEISVTDPVPWRVVNAFLESSLDKQNG